MGNSATLIEISRRAGLAVSSTADILRGRPGYNAQTRERIHRIAKELNYTPNWLGRALRAGKTMSIGLLGCLLEDASALMKASSIEAAARAEGYQVYFVNTSSVRLEEPASHLQRLDDLLARKVDGLIVDYVAVPAPESVLIQLQKQTIPVVYMDWAPPDAANVVAVNRAAGIRQAVHHLRQLGHRRVAIITNEWALTRPNPKMQTYRQELADAGIELVSGPEWVYEDAGGALEVNTHRVVLRQFRSGRNLPSALVLFDDLAATGAIRGVFDAGLKVPDDVSVVGFNDLGVASVTRPALTTVHQPRGEVGETAFGMLFRLMNDGTAPAAPVQFDCALVVRESTGPARREGAAPAAPGVQRTARGRRSGERG